MKALLKFTLKGLAVLLALLCVFLLVSSLLPKAVDLRVYGVRDEVTGGWLLVEMRRSEDGEKWTSSWRTGDGRGEGEFDEPLSSQSLKLSVDQRFDDHLLATLSEAKTPPRKLDLKLLAVGETDSSSIGFGCWGRAASLRKETSVLNWQPAMPHADAWKTLEKEERKRQEVLLEQDAFFTWGSWLSSFREGELKMEFEKLVDQQLSAMGDSWITLSRSCYEYSGGAHGNSFFEHETYVLEGGRARLCKTEELFGGKLPVEVLLPLLRSAYGKWGGGYVEAKELDKTLMESASIRPSSAGLVFCYNPYAIGPYAAGAPELVVPLSGFADAVDWKGPARLFWPKEAALRGK